jgi:hypothetical protein
MKKRIIIGLAALFALGTTVSCEKKYEDGPVVSLTPRVERMANTWIFAYAEQDGENVSDEFDQYELYMNAEYEAELDATYRAFGVEYSTTTMGTWSFQNEEEEVKFDYDDDEFDNEFKILRLLKDELWLKDMDENLEIHLLSK